MDRAGARNCRLTRKRRAASAVTSTLRTLPCPEIESESSLVRQWGKHRRPPRRRLPRWAWVVIAVSSAAVLGLVAWMYSGSEPWRPPSGSPHFASCTYGGYVDAWCGRLRVAADPRRPHGATISLRIAVLPATERPPRGALFYLEGGPGGAATDSAIRVNALFAPVGRERDLVMVDQRGTGGSGRLACPDSYVREGDAQAVTGYLRQCFARLDVDPRLYTTGLAADDLETVRRTLGYQKIDLYGVSYGATLAQTYLRMHPGSVRSAVLDSGSLLQVRIYDVSARNAERALRVQLARCAAQPACSRAYPHSRRQLGDVLARPPRAAPASTRTVMMRPSDVAWTVNWLSETADNAALIPFAVDAAAHGDYTPLATTYDEQLGGSNLEPLARLVPFWVILCSEPWAGFDPAATMRLGRGSYLARAALERARLFRRACRVVPEGRGLAGAGSMRAVRVPALLLAGSADPLDPPANLRGWRKVFPDGRLVVVRGAGHGTLEYGCIQKLVARFVERGRSAGLGAECARHASLPPFVLG
jgi:pimeloyl-ACP methyl ester carboxylesterase